MSFPHYRYKYSSRIKPIKTNKRALLDDIFEEMKRVKKSVRQTYIIDTEMNGPSEDDSPRQVFETADEACAILNDVTTEHMYLQDTFCTLHNVFIGYYANEALNILNESNMFPCDVNELLLQYMLELE